MTATTGFARDDQSEEELRREAEVAGGLAGAVRGLVDAVIRTEADEAELDDVRRQVDALAERLRARQLPGPYGVRIGDGGRIRNWGNAVVGVRNAVAPPLVIERVEGRVRSEFALGAAYEGPPGLVHGGVCALVLDQILGEAATAGGHPGMTGTLTLRYRRPTALGELCAEAEIDRVEGVKAIVRGRLMTPDREPTVEAEGIFILPRWARGQLAAT